MICNHMLHLFENIEKTLCLLLSTAQYIDLIALGVLLIKVSDKQLELPIKRGLWRGEKSEFRL